MFQIFLRLVIGQKIEAQCPYDEYLRGELLFVLDKINVKKEFFFLCLKMQTLLLTSLYSQ